MKDKLKNYFYLARFHRPVGIFLLLWPTLWALWLAGNHHPDFFVTVIFVTGVIVMRAAGCVINDIADQKFDAKVRRTRERPLATKKISQNEALCFFGGLMCCAFLLALCLNSFTLFLAFAGALFAITYPFLKRITYLPQVGLGIAFAWSVPMAFSELTNKLSPTTWLVFFAALLWPIIYDTMYAMVDREDDVKAGVKSTAILFAQHDTIIIGLLQCVFLLVLLLIGHFFKLHIFYFLSLLVTSFLLFYQQKLIHEREPAKCFKAFLNNQWVGLIIFLGIVAG